MPAQAQGHCWAEREVAAAQVREMQTMLMVAALRCRAAHIDISSDYNGFITTQKDALEHANLVIKQHFAAAGGEQADYDHFATSLANGFGDDQTNESSCAEASALAHDATPAAPAAIEAHGDGPRLPDRAARRQLRRARGRRDAGHDDGRHPGQDRSAADADRACGAAPRGGTGRGGPVTLPADVVAAMTVMARFQASQGSAAPVVVAVKAPTQLAAVR